MKGTIVLVVDDEDDVRELACEFLADIGFAVIPARNGAEALAVLERGDPIHLLFTDIAMPGDIDGVALAQKARHMRPDLPVLVTSGYARDARTAALPTATPFLRKPYRFADLETIVGGLLFR